MEVQPLTQSGHRSTLVSSNVALFFVGCLLLLLPLHTMVFYRMIPIATGVPEELMSIWKEAALALMICTILFYRLPFWRSWCLEWLDILVVTLFAVCVVYVLDSGDKKLALYGLRMIFAPLAAYYVCRSINVRFSVLQGLLKAYIAVAFVVAAWAILQAALLGESFLISWGYPATEGRLHHSFYIAGFLFQRAVGSFASPNNFGLFCSGIIVIGAFLYKERLVRHNKILLAAILVISAGLIYSFSRSAWLAMLMSFLIYGMLSQGMSGAIKFVLLVIAALATTILLALAIVPDVIEPVISHVSRTVDMSDPSASGHVSSWLNSFDFVQSHPFGAGLGVSGPRASRITGQFLNSENSFFIVAIDMGLLGIATYAGILYLIISRLVRATINLEHGREQRLIYVVIAIALGQMIVAWNLLPVIVELEITIPVFILLGLADQLSKRAYQ